MASNPQAAITFSRSRRRGRPAPRRPGVQDGFSQTGRCFHVGSPGLRVAKYPAQSVCRRADGTRSVPNTMWSLRFVNGAADDGAVERVAFDGLAAGLDDHVQDLIYGQGLRRGRAGRVMDALLRTVPSRSSGRRPAAVWAVPSPTKSSTALTWSKLSSIKRLTATTRRSSNGETGLKWDMAVPTGETSAAQRPETRRWRPASCGAGKGGRCGVPGFRYGRRASRRSCGARVGGPAMDFEPRLGAGLAGTDFRADLRVEDLRAAAGMLPKPAAISSFQNPADGQSADAGKMVDLGGGPGLQVQAGKRLGSRRVIPGSPIEILRRVARRLQRAARCSRRPPPLAPPPAARPRTSCRPADRPRRGCSGIRTTIDAHVRGIDVGIAVVVGRVDGAFGRVRKRPDTGWAPAGGVGQSAQPRGDRPRERTGIRRRPPEPLLGLDLPPNLVELQMGHSSLSQMNPCHNSAKCSNRWNSVILSAAKNLASVAVQARFFAALRMTVVWLVQTAEVLRILLL